MKVTKILKLVEQNDNKFSKKMYEFVKNLENLDSVTLYENKYIDEALRLYFINKVNRNKKYYICIDQDYKNSGTIFFSNLKVSDHELKKLLLELNIKKKPNDNYKIYITKKSSNGVVLNKHNTNILFNYQSLQFITCKNYERSNSFQKLQNIDMFEKNNNILYGNVVLHLLGIVPLQNNKIDILQYNDINVPVLGTNDIPLNTFNICSIDTLNSIILNSTNCKYEYFNSLWPKLLNVDSLDTIINDPEYHAYYNNTKIITINLLVKLLQNKLKAKTLTFIHMFNKYNDNGTQIPLCYPNLIIEDNGIKIVTDNFISKKLEKINSYLESLKEDKIVVPRCSELPHEIYSMKPERNVYTNGIIKYHNNVVNYYISRYLDKDKLLDVGAGPLRQIIFYEKIGLKKLVALEPSQDSINTGIERYNTTKKRVDLTILPGFGEDDWLKPEYKQIVLNKPYKSILLKFTIHYMLHNIDQLFINLQNVSIKGTKILVTCVNGDLLLDKMKHDGKYEVRSNGDILYGVYDFDNSTSTDYRKVMVYFKGVYGVENGSIEYIVSLNYIIKKFKEYGFKLVFNSSFMQLNVPKLINIRNDYVLAQSLISELHNILMFEKL